MSITPKKGPRPPGAPKWPKLYKTVECAALCNFGGPRTPETRLGRRLGRLQKDALGQPFRGIRRQGGLDTTKRKASEDKKRKEMGERK